MTRITYFDDFNGPNPHAYLSNFYREPLVLAGLSYPTGEHAFQAYKAASPRQHELIREAASPSTAKALGRRTPLRPDWEAVKYDVMRQVLRSKFKVGSKLAVRLLDTGTAMLVEGTDWGDQVWGVKRTNMRGRNWLGHLLMARRAELQTGEPDEDFTVALRFIKGIK